MQIFVGDTETYAFKSPLARPFNTSEGFKNALKQAKPVGGGSIMTLMGVWAAVHVYYCDAVLSNIEVMEEIERADLVISDALYLCGSLIAAKFSLPHVTVFTNSLSTPTAHAFSLPQPPAYVPQFQSGFIDELSFVERIRNTYQWIVVYLVYHFRTAPPFKELKDKYNISPKRSLYETLGRVDLIIGQMGFFLDYPRPLLPSKSEH